MSDFEFTRPERDYLGLKKCDPCHNGSHWHKSDKKLGPVVVIWDCLGTESGCECQCRQLFLDQAKKRKRIVPDYSRQTEIDTGEDVIQFGHPRKHEDRG